MNIKDIEADVETYLYTKLDIDQAYADHLRTGKLRGDEEDGEDRDEDEDD